MGTDYGACGAFGLLLGNYVDKKPIRGLHQEFVEALARWEQVAAEGGEFPLSQSEAYEQIAGPFARRFIQAFKRLGIIVPHQAELHWTGSVDDRPARCETAAEDWILGFGLFTLPWNYPKQFHRSFKEKAGFHNWVWMG